MEYNPGEGFEMRPQQEIEMPEFGVSQQEFEMPEFGPNHPDFNNRLFGSPNWPRNCASLLAKSFMCSIVFLGGGVGGYYLYRAVNDESSGQDAFGVVAPTSAPLSFDVVGCSYYETQRLEIAHQAIAGNLRALLITTLEFQLDVQLRGRIVKCFGDEDGNCGPYFCTSDPELCSSEADLPGALAYKFNRGSANYQPSLFCISEIDSNTNTQTEGDCLLQELMVATVVSDEDFMAATATKTFTSSGGSSEIPLVRLAVDEVCREYN